MSGNYPDPPGPRLAYDRDGSQVYARWGSVAFDILGTQQAAGVIQSMNNESTLDSLSAGYGASDAAVVVIFPSLRDISHIHISAVAFNSFSFAWSPDTTNGIDGTWNAVTVTNQANTRLAQRTLWSATPTILGAKAIRYTLDNGAGTDPRTYSLHLYGKPSAPASNRLEIWHPTLDQSMSATPAELDWGNRPRGTTQTRQFRVKNVSTVQTASDITVSVQALTDADPPMVSQYQVRYNGGAYGATAAIPILAPGGISEIIDIEQALLANAALSIWTQRVIAAAATWT